MSQTLYKYFSRGTIFFIILFIVDFIVELFQIDKTSSIVTLLGLRIDIIMDNSELKTLFSLDIRVLYSYIIVVAIFILVGYFLNRKKGYDA